MKTTIPKDTLLSSLLRAGKFTTGIRVQNENLGTFITLRKNEMVVSGIQETRFFQEKIVCETDAQDESTFATDTKKLTEFLQNVGSAEIHVSLESTGLRISAEKTRALFPIAVRPEPPSIPQDKVGVVSLDPKVVLATLPQLLFCVAADSARPTLSSIKCIPQDGNRVLFITTDGFRLSIVQTSLAAPIEKNLQIPAVFFRDVFHSVVDSTQKVALVFHEDERISFQQKSVVVGTQLVGGDFPPYERVMVRNFTQNIVIARDEFIQAIKTIAIFTREHSNIIVFEFTNKSFTVRPKKEAGGENRTELSADIQGQEVSGLTLAFNYRYLLDFLSSVEDDFITMRINRPDSPALFLAGKLSPSDPHEGVSYQHIIMPVRIQE